MELTKAEAKILAAAQKDTAHGNITIRMAVVSGVIFGGVLVLISLADKTKGVEFSFDKGAYMAFFWLMVVCFAYYRSNANSLIRKLSSK